MKQNSRPRTTAMRLLFRYILYGIVFAAPGILLGLHVMEETGYGYRAILFSGILLEVFVFTAYLLFGYRNIYKMHCQINAALRKVSEVSEGIEGESDVDRICRTVVRLNGYTNKKNTQKMLVKQAELNALQNQINPHFLYNTLECIRGKAMVQGVEQIANMTEALSAFFRYSISIQENLVTLEQELQNTKNYFLIQEYRFGNRFRLQIFWEEESEGGEYLMPKMTLQPIVENAIFHGLEKSVSEGAVTIRVTATEKRLILAVQDNGVGIPGPALKEIRESLNGLKKDRGEEGMHSGIALSNINERIHLHFGFRYGISINSEEGLGTEITITLPAVKKTAGSAGDRRQREETLGRDGYEAGAFADGAYHENAI
ncbi:sensor histidine kinase [Lacrimispora sp. NSJ-141]|uniref:histidine kinase n=1 Tax=Lientehia hominis TaxID=2897778 RepID=A0AAP2RKN3_9FIRM|nr:sensor histidine kinase [Lientehia hominis]MCD2493188.1 sensor histidine kinase [Lientehia hominis]